MQKLMTNVLLMLIQKMCNMMPTVQRMISSDEDEEYIQPPDDDSFADDEEVEQMRKFAKEVKRNIKAKKLGVHSSQITDIRVEDLVTEVPNLDDPGNPYMDSSDDYSYEEGSDGEAQRKDNKLVTSNRIAEYYYDEIKDNPSWKVELMKKAVLRGMIWLMSLYPSARECIQEVHSESNRENMYMQAAYMRTYDHVFQPIEGPGKWPISDMPRPQGLAYVKMPGRPKTQRRREPGEASKGSKLSKVGTKIKCRLCGKYDHNARTCSKNADAGKKKNAYIKRDAARKRKAEAAGPSKNKRTKPTATAANRRMTRGERAMASQPSQSITQGNQQPTQASSVTDQPIQRATRGN
ncbi:hypothetical protein BS78_10G129900 [Paspalum vaginatum]|nr:hypothetical protein BS78_10G129900 [Paspalum vaginatum]